MTCRNTARRGDTTGNDTSAGGLHDPVIAGNMTNKHDAMTLLVCWLHFVLQSTLHDLLQVALQVALHVVLHGVLYACCMLCCTLYVVMHVACGVASNVASSVEFCGAA